MEFQDLCTFETFQQFWSHYGYEGKLEDMIEQEFSRTKGMTYLDHAAATLYPESLLRDYCQDISRNVYGNPHSRNPSSRLTHDTLERVRYRILQHFNTTPEEYSVIFTSGSTAALKVVAESFPWRAPSDREAGSYFSYLTDNHTSVVGIRGKTFSQGVVTLPVSPQALEDRAKDKAQGDDDICQTPHLFCYPAQSNFSGWKYPLNYVTGIQGRCLYPACDHPGRWFVLLDAASHISCSPLDLHNCPADFVPISFYKLFGFPTGLGALLVHNNAASMLKKAYFGGGTAAAYLSGEDYYIHATNISDRFEDGTVAFLDIIAINHAFDALYRITGGMHCIQQHTFGLARYTYMLLSSLCHGNKRPVAQMYTQGQFESPSTQGAILNFNLVDSHGQIIGYSKVERMASLYNIHLRTGCFCNTGACQYFLGITDQQMKRNVQVYNWPVGPHGLLYDRCWMVVNRNGVCLSQKREPSLCLVQPQVHLSSNKLLLQAPGMDTISVPLKNTSDMRSRYKGCQSKVCGDRVEAVDCGDEAASWFSDFLGQPCRLISQNPNFSRDTKKKSIEGATTPSLSLVNEAQYLMINSASVQLIQELMSSRQENSMGDQQLDTKNITSRFRTNFIIAGVEAFEEDNWSHLVIGNTRFVVTGHCGRCHMVGVDQETGAKTKEPLLSLSTYRTGKVNSQHQQFQALLMREKMNYPPCYYVFLGDFRRVPDASVIRRDHSSPVCRLHCSARAKRLLK
ncbi:molybdenum cofactor sulfurase isoform X3 [Takifugu rubripes]|uniref:molybdenum cofactor sulfurase isoform X3 n=1 Tax=Takifugu rubripes TaxID=31033 RepID=UPI0011456266|nr:molybdenum cofactor sulfurase isoform X3 [Takifugu rubripes]